jgi:hypothetical protein
MGARAALALGNGRTIEAPGTSQAFRRASLVRVELDDTAAAIVRRPTLIGALLGKATAVTRTNGLKVGSKPSPTVPQRPPPSHIQGRGP